MVLMTYWANRRNGKRDTDGICWRLGTLWNDEITTDFLGCPGFGVRWLFENYISKVDLSPQYWHSHSRLRKSCILRILEWRKHIQWIRRFEPVDDQGQQILCDLEPSSEQICSVQGLLRSKFSNYCLSFSYQVPNLTLIARKINK